MIAFLLSASPINQLTQNHRLLLETTILSSVLGYRLHATCTPSDSSVAQGKGPDTTFSYKKR
jgi:hypothetical protein